MKLISKSHPIFNTLAGAGLIAAGVGAAHLTLSHAQDVPPAPYVQDGPPGGPRPHGGPRGPRDEAGPRREHEGPGGRREDREGPGPRGPRPEDEAPAPPVDPQAAPGAVKTAATAVAGLAPGQVWVHTAPRGEQEIHATLLFENREVARLTLDARTGEVLARGRRPPASPRIPVAEPAVPPVDAAAPVAPKPNPAPLDMVKTRLPQIIKELSVGQGAEAIPREGFWRVPLIDGNRVVGELRLSGDGSKVIQDFAAARDAAIFAR